MILWDLTDPTQPRRIGDPLTGHTDAVHSVAFAPDGQHPGHRQRRRHA